MKSLKTIVKHKGLIRKFGNWSLELLPSGRVQASDGWINVSITLYSISGYTWEQLPKNLVDWLRDNYNQLEKVQAQYLDHIGGYYKPDMVIGMLDADYWKNFELK